MSQITPAVAGDRARARTKLATVGRAAISLLGLLPRGSTLPYAVWQRRHFGILVLLWSHVPLLFLVAVFSGETVVHSLTEAVAIAAFALGATLTRHDRRQSTLVSCFGLLTCSAMLVHLSEGLIEMHFHYFVMVGVVTLYQEWRPFLMSIGYVVLQHGIAGALAPESVYNHAAAIESPWLWACVHGLFILGMSGTGIVSWRLNETLLASAEQRQAVLAEAQRVARLGSWEWQPGTSHMEWSDELFHLLGRTPGDVEPSVELFVSHVHGDDLARVQREIDVATGAEEHIGGSDFRIVTVDGTARWIQSRWRAISTPGDSRLRLAGTLQDITERKRAENELREAVSLLNATFDATADGILVVDLEGSIVSFNHRFADMWRIPSEVLASRDDDQALAFVLEQVDDPEAFLAKVRELYAQPGAESEDVIQFTDGRVFERSSRPQRVDGAVVGRVWSFRDVTEHTRLENELAHQAFHDSLTNLANQALFRDRVEHALARSARGRNTLAVVFIDLDNFKTVNDSLGHTAGDELLVLVTERLASCIRSGDTAARLGGDEFAILLEDLEDQARAVDVAQRLIHILREPITVAGQDVYVSASVGIAFEVEGVGVDQIMRNADLAMYTAKRKGKGRFELYEPEMHTVAVRRLEVEGDLRRALEPPHELVIHYQPVVSLNDRRAWGAEALVRWQHPTRGLLLPGDFIALAEETGLIVGMGRIVLREACTALQEVRTRQERPDLTVSVNLAPRQLLGGTIVDDVVGTLADTGLPASALVLEITEGAMMEDPDLAIATLEELKSLGVRLAVDDFGTGYSSLSYLQRFPIDIVKIDRSFVEKLGGTADTSLLPAIVGLTRSLGLIPVAEGVETADQASSLRNVGCELAQGFLLARPMDERALGAFFAQVPRARGRRESHNGRSPEPAGAGR